METLEFRMPEGERTPLAVGIDLILVDGRGREQRHPLCFSSFRIGTSGPDFEPDLRLEDFRDDRIQVYLQYVDGQVFVENRSPRLTMQVNHQVTVHHEVFESDVIQLGDNFLFLVGLRPALATLEGYLPPHARQRWILREGANAVGREGKRFNHIMLDDPTVSRSHATVTVTEDSVFLHCETGSSQTLLNGKEIGQGATEPLQDGDLLQVGRQLLRLRVVRASATGSLQRDLATAHLRFSSTALGHDRVHHYRQALELVLHRLRPPDLHILPFWGEGMSVCSVGDHQRTDFLLRVLLDLLADFHSAHAEGLRCALSIGLHVGHANSSNAGASYAEASRPLQVAQALATGENTVRLSRAAWEKSELSVVARRTGVVLPPGQTIPIEAYEIEEMLHV